MSLHEKCLSCNTSEITLDELVKALFVKDAEGNIGIELKLNVCDADNTPAVSCDLADPSVTELLKMSMVIDDCDKCSLKVFVDGSALRAFICEIVEECDRQ